MEPLQLYVYPADTLTPFYRWTEIRKIKDTTFTLSKLIIDTDYVFRSIAVNEVDLSKQAKQLKQA